MKDSLDTIDNGSDLELHLAPGQCGCGCGASVNGKRQFLQGHDAKLKSALITTALEGGRVVVAEGGTRTESDAQSYAGRYGFGDQVRKAVLARTARAVDRANRDDARRAAKSAQRAKPDEAEVKALVDAPRNPDEVTAKVGRWTYRGHLHGDEFTYATKSGEVVVTTKFEVVA